MMIPLQLLLMTGLAVQDAAPNAIAKEQLLPSFASRTSVFTRTAFSNRSTCSVMKTRRSQQDW